MINLYIRLSVGFQWNQSPNDCYWWNQDLGHSNHDRLPFRSNVIALVVQNLPKSVLYIQIFFLLMKDVAFLFSCFHHYHCGYSNWLLVASLIQQMSFLSCLFLDIFQKKIHDKNDICWRTFPLQWIFCYFYSLMESSLFSPSVVVTFLQFWFHVKILESELLIQDMRLAFYFYAMNF